MSLKKKDITLKEMYNLSKHLYKTSHVDDKAKRAKVDIVNARVTARNNLSYDPSIKQWVQTGRSLKIETLVSSKPTSYKKTDTVAIHRYPVVFIIQDIALGLDSPFKWRTGSNYRPRFPKKGDSKEKRLKLINENIKKGIQLQEFFNLEWVAKQYGLLYGPCRANRAPKITNPKLEIYFDKTAWFVFMKIITPLLTTRKGALSKIFKNDGKGLTGEEG